MKLVNIINSTLLPVAVLLAGCTLQTATRDIDVQGYSKTFVFPATEEKFKNKLLDTRGSSKRTHINSTYGSYLEEDIYLDAYGDLVYEVSAFKKNEAGLVFDKSFVRYFFSVSCEISISAEGIEFCYVTTSRAEDHKKGKTGKRLPVLTEGEAINTIAVTSFGHNYSLAAPPELDAIFTRLKAAGYAPKMTIHGDIAFTIVFSPLGRADGRLRLDGGQGIVPVDVTLLAADVNGTINVEHLGARVKERLESVLR